MGNNVQIVNTKEPYTYERLQDDLKKLKDKYSFLQIETIGESIQKRAIQSVRIGTGQNEVMYSASIHANEYITTNVLMKFIEDFCDAYVRDDDIFEHSAKMIFNTSSIYIVPLLNPDGVELVTGNIREGSQDYMHYKQISDQFPTIPFPSGWKANYNGVDLNLQFPAGWTEAREIKFAQGFNRPAPRDFVGFGPLTEPEALAIYNFTLKHNFRLILAYHTQGEVIFWRYSNYLPQDSAEIGKIFSKVSKYTLSSTPPESSNAGLKDWFIMQFNRPGYTIEAGLGTNPLPMSQFDKIYNDNIGILVLGSII